MHHISRCQGLREFFEHAPHGLPAHAAKAGFPVRGTFEFAKRPALPAFGGCRAGQGRDACLGVGAVRPGPSRARKIEHCEIDAALQVRCARAPQRRAPHAQHGHDPRLGHPAVKAGKGVRSSDLSRLMHSLASNLLDGCAVGLRQAKLGLSHGYILAGRSAASKVYPCSFNSEAAY